MNRFHKKVMDLKIVRLSHAWDCHMNHMLQGPIGRCLGQMTKKLHGHASRILWQLPNAVFMDWKSTSWNEVLMTLFKLGTSSSLLCDREITGIKTWPSWPDRRQWECWSHGQKIEIKPFPGGLRLVIMVSFPIDTNCIAAQLIILYVLFIITVTPLCTPLCTPLYRFSFIFTSPDLHNHQDADGKPRSRRRPWHFVSPWVFGLCIAGKTPWEMGEQMMKNDDFWMKRANTWKGMMKNKTDEMSK